MPENKSFKCNQCDGSCEGLKTTAKAYYHWIIKVDIEKQKLKKDSKPDCCERCEESREVSFLTEPFCAEILEINCPFWLCDWCYSLSKDDI